MNEKKSESDSEMLEKALNWLSSSQNDNGSFNSTYFLYNSTCEALSVLRNNADMFESEQLDNLLTKADSFVSKVGYSDDFDRSCHYFMCCSNTDSDKQTEFYENVLKNQNADGGFGLTARYESDDTTETGVYKITAECIFNDNVLFEKSIDNLIASGERTITVAEKPAVEDIVLKTAMKTLVTSWTLVTM